MKKLRVIVTATSGISDGIGLWRFVMSFARTSNYAFTLLYFFFRRLEKLSVKPLRNSRRWRMPWNSNFGKRERVVENEMKPTWELKKHKNDNACQMKTKGAKNLLNACSHSETLSENQIYKVISISCWLIQLS